MNTMATTQFSMRISEELKAKLQILSEVSHRSQSYLGTKAIEEYINRNEWKLKSLQEAKQEADKGVFISQDAMELWVDSLGTENELTAPTPDIFPN